MNPFMQWTYVIIEYCTTSCQHKTKNQIEWSTEPFGLSALIIQLQHYKGSASVLAISRRRGFLPNNAVLFEILTHTHTRSCIATLLSQVQ